MIGKTIDEIKLGDKAEFPKTVTETDVYLFAGINGDFNPAHINEMYASKTLCKTRIAHGMLLVGFISTVVGNQLPGYGTIYVKQDMTFLSPVYIGDTVTAYVGVTEILINKKHPSTRRARSCRECTKHRMKSSYSMPQSKTSRDSKI